MAFAAAAQAALPTASVGGHDATCSATSVLYEIDRRDRRKLEQILDDASRVANAQAVLWRIEKAGVAPSYLFGTVHVIDESLQELSPRVSAAIDQAKVVAIGSTQPSRSALVHAMAEDRRLMVSAEKELQRILADDEMTVVEKAISDAGYPTQMALELKPWAATMFLADSSCQKDLQNQGLKSIDALVAERAEAKGVRLVGLETILEQYQALAAVSDPVQVAWLKASIEMHRRVDDVSQTISELYRFRRLDAVWPLTQEMAPQAGLDDATLGALRHELVAKRNQLMLDRALPLLDEGGSFIAVGAMHQMGPGGLVALLQQKGFTVTALE